MKLKLKIAGVLTVAGLALAAPASADLTLLGLHTDTSGGNVTYDATVDRGSVGCTSCEGAITNLASGTYAAPRPNASDHDGFSGTEADFFQLSNSSDASELAFIEAISGEDFTSGVKTDGGGGDLVFSTDAEWILLKVGQEPNYAVIHNTNGLQEFSFDGDQGTGLSHWTAFGGTTTVSEPGMLALFGVGLMLLGFMRRRAIA